MKNLLFPNLAWAALFLIFTPGQAQNIPNQPPTQKTEILWDSWEVPHIYAESYPALGYGFGWAQMQSYANEILKLYGLSRGRGAEFWGEEYINSDHLMHQVGIPEDALKTLNQQPEELKKYLQAFADGMNAYALKHPDQINAGMKQVLPVQPEDIISHVQRAFFTFVGAQGNSPSIINLTGLPPETQPGSNTIAIGPSRSQSGNAMLLQNPHLPWNIPLMRFYEAHLIGPDLDLYGTTLIGTPMIVIGFNQYMGWSHTVNTVDLLDTYRLKLRSGGYQYNGETLKFKERRKIIRKRGKDGSLKNDTLNIRHSVHGPVIQSTDTSAIAIRTPMLDNPGLLQQFWEMGRAKNLEEFQAALRQHQLPMFTTTYADRDGHIYYLFTGQIPKRPYGDFGLWQQPVAGDSSATLWTEIHTFDELPHLLDPESGFLQNSNSPPWFATIPSPLNPGDFPEYMAPQGLNPREQRGLEMLLEREQISFEDLMEIRYSTRMLLADRVLDDLLPAAKNSTDSITRASAEVLSTWDRHADPQSKGAVLFAFWAGELCKTKMCGMAEPWDPHNPLSTPNGLANPDAAATLLGKVAIQVREKFGSLDVAWGDVMRLNDDIPGVGAPGSPFGVFQVMVYQPSEKGEFRPIHGDTWVAVIEFTKNGPRAEVLMSYGNSSNSDDRQLELLSNKKMRPAWNTRELIEKNLKSTTHLEYKKF